MQETERWLKKCGFVRIGPRVWEAKYESLRFLDDEEILAIEPISFIEQNPAGR